MHVLAQNKAEPLLGQTAANAAIFSALLVESPNCYFWTALLRQPQREQLIDGHARQSRGEVR